MSWGQVPVAVKQVAAPASDIEAGLVRLPDPAKLAVTSHSLMLPVEFVRDRGGWSWSMPISVKTASGARIAFLPSVDGFWETDLVPAGDDDGQLVPMAPRASWESLPWIAPERTFVCLQTPDGQPANWNAIIRSAEPIDGYVIIDDGSGVELSTGVDSLVTLSGRPITLHSEFSDGYSVKSVEAEIVPPDGAVMVVSAAAGGSDVVFTPRSHGRYTVRVTAVGMNAQGERVMLSTQHLIHAERPAPALGEVATRVLAGEGIEFGFAPDSSSRRTVVAAEVWGERDGEMAAVCWLSRVCGADRSLVLDPRWISVAGVDPATLELRNLRLHDVDSMVPLELIEREEIGALRIGLPAFIGEPTGDMLRGRSPRMVVSPVNASTNRSVLPGHRLMLVHGYCTDANPFPTGHFSGDLAVFEDYGQSRSHDGFALEMLSQSAPMKSFGVVGHSQGGMGALHLLTFYWSGLDWARNGERLIQSVGAPYQGTALAGNAAVLGDLFGFGCGVNDSMTYAGSAAWLSTIPSWARSEVWYWTSSFEERPFLYDYCNIITDLLLSDPDDGVIERSAGQLPGAHNMGHTEGWCHTTGMRDPAQCTDSARNADMNARAKR